MHFKIVLFFFKFERSELFFYLHNDATKIYHYHSSWRQLSLSFSLACTLVSSLLPFRKCQQLSLAEHPSRGIHRASLKAKNPLKRTILIVELHKRGYLRRLSVSGTDSVTYEGVDATFCCIFKNPFKHLISFFVCVLAKGSFKNKFPLAAYAAMRLFVHSVPTHSDIKLVEWDNVPFYNQITALIAISPSSCRLLEVAL